MPGREVKRGGKDKLGEGERTDSVLSLDAGYATAMTKSRGTPVKAEMTKTPKRSHRVPKMPCHRMRTIPPPVSVIPENSSN